MENFNDLVDSFLKVAKGEKGEQGKQGEKGKPGEQGEKGNVGIGLRGLKGDTFTYGDMSEDDKADLVDISSGQWNQPFAEKYDKLEQEYATDLTQVKTELAETQTQFQQVIAGSTDGDEVINARGIGNATLKVRLDSTDAQLAEKVQNFNLKNEVVNGGNFANTIGWTNLVAAALSVSNNFLVVTNNGSNATTRFTCPLTATIGDKFYMRATIRVTNSDATSLAIFASQGTLTDGDFVVPLINTFHNISSIFTANRVNPLLLLEHKYASTEISNGKVAELKNAMAINLTQTFGIGNEPTKVEMDELIKVIPNQWWDGELTLTQKQVVTWQLNLIRKNTNAIIALGGTII